MRTCQAVLMQEGRECRLVIELSGLNFETLHVVFTDFRTKKTKKWEERVMPGVTMIETSIQNFSHVQVFCVEYNGIPEESIMEGLFYPGERINVGYHIDQKSSRVVLSVKDVNQFNTRVSTYDLSNNDFYYSYNEMKFVLPILPFQNSAYTEYIISNNDALRQFQLEVQEPYDFLFQIREE